MRRARMRQDVKTLADDLRFVSYAHKQRFHEKYDETTTY